MWQKWKIRVRSEEKAASHPWSPTLAAHPVWDGTESFNLGMKEESGLRVQGA